MILTIQQLARAVAVALEDEVLPAFEARSWPASRVRSSLGLLQLIIDQAEHEERALAAGNRLMRTFLQSATASDAKAGPDVSDVNGPAPPATAAEYGVDIHAVRRESQQLREQLSDIIRSSRGKRETGGAEAEGSRQALHQLLRELEVLEKPIYDEAIRFLPM